MAMGKGDQAQARAGRRFAEQTGVAPASWLAREAHPSPPLLLASQEGVLAEATAGIVSSHLAQCGLCRRLLEDLQQPEFASPSAVEVARMRKALPHPPERQRRLPVGIAVTVLVAALGVFTVRSLPDPSSGPLKVSPAPKKPPATASQPSFRISEISADLKLLSQSVPAARQNGRQNHPAYAAEFERALEFYQQRKFNEAALLLQSLASQYPQRIEAPFYAGVSLLMANDPVQALEWLTKKPLPRDHPLYADQIWYRAAALERTGDDVEAAELLNKLCAAAGPYRERACAAVKTR
jgi:hypothetical protein